MVQVDYRRDALLDDYAIEILKDRYMLPEESSPQDAFARAAKAFADDDAHAQRLYDYVSNLWFMFSSPILSNGGNTRGMPISCFLSYVPDSRSGLGEHYIENIWLSSMGGGIGSYWGDVRSDGSATSHGSRSTGSIPFIHVVDSQVLAFSQGTNRRGAYAAYQDISHPEVEEFITMRKPTGGDINRRNLNLHHGINVSDKFMELIYQCSLDPSTNDDWELIDPKTQKVTKTVSAKALWESILETRVTTGEPYLHFIDTTNKAVPEVHKLLGLDIKTSNLCVAPETLVLTEIGRAHV
jgi:ribonucleotide reductase alpha subunit